jgi:inner membrane protein
MDSITQGVLGAAIGEAMLSKKLGNKGALIGAIVATIPDLDIIFHLFYDSFEMLSIHRGYSHSILFSVLGAMIVSLILKKIKVIEDLKFKKLLLFSWLCLFTHMLLDTFTAYGTQLFLPFSNKRLGFDSINVVDPVYTLPLIIGLIFSLWIYKSSTNRSLYNKWGLILSSAYLVFTLINKERVNSNIENEFAINDIQYNSLMTMPVGIANINWYGVAKATDSLHMIQYSPFSKDKEKIESFPVNEELLKKVDPEMANMMRWFAKGNYTVTKENDKIRIYNLQVDMRGIVEENGKKAPTVGYFEIATKNGKSEFSSGSIKVDISK